MVSLEGVLAEGLFRFQRGFQAGVRSGHFLSQVFFRLPALQPRPPGAGRGLAELFRARPADEGFVQPELPADPQGEIITADEIRPGELWITHGREEALARWAELHGIKARALALVGYDDEAED